ncbi:hypothetical protein DFH07DRAFT_740406 [Mycena maculata]|uniref:PIPK domain-containing protein n=1 Tax=Mycena maculata TaxID=230809 RepID=A0AAD7JE99_9AGAR|nr:hypothetical protein DFH07DRAFT_740406 [Mycena maculata]
MATSKPLPEIPPPLTLTSTTNNETANDNRATNIRTNLTILTSDARTHRGAVLRYLLADVGLNMNEDERDDWADALEGGLDGLGEAVARGRWLAGVKRSRLAPTRPTMVRFDTASSTQSSASAEQADTAPPTETADTVRDRLAALRLLASQPTLPNPTPSPKHLLLCVAPLGSRIALPLPAEDSGFALVSARVACAFSPGSFVLPEDGEGNASSVLYGLAEWDSTWLAFPNMDVRLVGGTFAFRGITSSAQHRALCTTLRVGVYVHLALLLEQHFLADSGVRLHFPAPRPLLPHSNPLSPSIEAKEEGADTQKDGREQGQGRLGKGKAFLPGILSFFGKKRSNPSLHRNSNSISTFSPTSHTSTSTFPSTSTTATARSGGASLDISRDASRLSSDSGRRFSFIGASPLSLSSPFSTQSSASTKAAEEKDGDTFNALLARLTATAPLLSASPNLRIAPPPLVAELAARERLLPAHPPPVHARKGADKDRGRAGMVLRGDERVGLSSILGWDPHAREKGVARGAGMGGRAGFTRMQALSVLVSRHVPAEPAPAPASTASTASAGSGRGAKADSAASSMELERSAETQQQACGRPGWTTWRFYARAGGEDRSLGESVRALAACAGEPCARSGCAFAQGKHVQRIVHGGVRVAISVEESLEREDGEDGIEMWVSCAVCGARTEKKMMSEGTFLFSWAKFLELLVYSPTVGTLAAPLCAHTDTSTSTFSSTSTADRAELPSARLNLVRHFAPRGTGHTVRVALAALGDVFELRVPRLQIARRGAAASIASARTSMASCSTPTAGRGKDGDGDEKRTLRREITAWWAGVADHMDALETTLVGSTLVGFRKALPRLPSVDDAWDSADDTDESAQTTPTRESAQPAQTTPTRMKAPHWIAGLPPSAPTTPQITKSAQDFFPSPPLARASSDPVVPAAPSSSSSSSSSDLTPTSSVAATGSATAPVSAESLPLPTSDSPPPDSLALLTRLRETFQHTEQALYAQLLASPVGALNDVRRSFLLAARGAEKRLRAWQTKHLRGIAGRKRKGKPPPGLELRAPEPEWWGKGCHTAPGGNVIIREDDWGSIIAFTMSTTDYYRELASMSLPRGSAGTSPGGAALTPALNNPTSSFFSAPSNYKLFASSTQAPPDPDQDGVVWYEPEAYSAVISRKEHPRDVTSLLSLREVLRQKSPIDSMNVSVLTGGGGGGSSRFGSLGSAATKGSSASAAPPSAWAKPDVQITRHAAGGEVSGAESAESAGKMLHEIDAAGSREGELSRPSSALSGSFLASAIFADAHIKRGKASSVLSSESDDTIGGKNDESAHTAPLVDEPEIRHGKDATTASDMPTPTPSSFTNTLTSGLSSAMRYMLSNGDVPRPSMFSKNHHGLLVPADTFAIDERPHIKYDWTIGKRLKFSCTVYYAKQFDNLRKRCGIDDVFLKSLSRSANWAAEGGKSKSNFWKTADDRFIIKTLVNAWNVADLQVLIELAPSYFRYMDATASRATVLAKLIGFYTIEIRNLETGNVQSKADLLVMENLFYDQKIVKTFDLKGIQGRKVKSSASGAAQNVKTLFDGEWIEGQQRTLTLVRPHSKVVLREAIRSDAEFLAKSNIMDYSLLLGVDQERKQIACGLVDTIGPYTFAKTLEYKAKQGLNSGKDVTVIPPAEYQERFVSALDGYFLACPDKWSRPMDDTRPIDDPGLLPSVL